ncbi:hypothetical protein D0868_02203 [Hortaea werneckii]|uniref:SP-RING-type domain-containing protein n=1 Tax=Hortaea werneckii TaxID=91943 RepID=A0A3M6ZCQ2_HORWE|nr:hypothetical protein D0868_02203 [Hortaea werneckii]
MVQDGPSPKRRRADNAQAISAESMRQTNSTLRLLTGGKQNRWMQDWASNGGQGGAGGSATVTPAVPVGGTNGRFDASLGREQQALQLDRRTSVGRTELNNQRHDINTELSGVANNALNGGARPSSGDATIVDYESPDLSVPGSGGPPGQAGKKRLDLQARTATGQGLPSPASSDDNAHSPVIGVHDTASRTRHGRPPSRVASTAFQSPRAPRDASSVREISTNPGQSRNIAPRPSTHNPGVPSNAALTRQAPFSHLPHPNLPPPPPPQVLPSNYSHLSSRSPSVREQDQGQLPLPRRDDPSIYEKRSGPEAHTGVGRLFLLREAVLKNDWFYIVLHQLSCLHTLIPGSLPQSARLIEQDAFDRLDALLCPNTMLQAPLVHWFSCFPAPMTTIATAAGGEGQRAYQYHGERVVSFLKALRRSWNSIIEESQRRLAPPLVQDMIEELTLLSPVLQTTMFRAVARMFWHAVPEYESGIEVLLALHHRDQSAYNPHVLPPVSWKANAYHSFKLVLDEWTKHIQRTRPPRPPFQIPRFALATFGIGVAGSGNRQSIQPAPATNRSPVMGGPHQIAHGNQQGMHTPTQHRHWQPGQGHPQSVQTSRGYLSTRTRSNSLANMATSANETLLQQMASSCLGPHSPVQAAYSQSALRPTVLNQQQQFQQSKRLLIPAAKDCPRAQPTHPDFTRSALHQAHLRSPIPGPATLEPNAQKLFRQVTGCALSPNKIACNRPHQSWTFKPLDAHFNAVPPLTYGPEDKTKRYRILGDGAVTYRLRCCKFEPAIGFPDLSTWVTTDCYWPETALFQLNGKALEARKKLHFGRYLPIDVTQYMSKGESTLDVYLNRSSQDKSAFDFAVGIEVVQTISEERLLGKIQTISAKESLDTIKKSLSTTPKGSNERSNDANDDEDDEIIMTSSTLTIPLFDPISAHQIFTVPVRGTHCRHRDPFDLATFLATRKREQPGYPSSPDDWRCPICRGDARPDVLVQDAFLISVREELARRDSLSTRAIIVSANGRWEVRKEELGSGVRSPSLEEGEDVGGSRGVSQRPSSAAPVVIELD